MQSSRQFHPHLAGVIDVHILIQLMLAAAEWDKQMMVRDESASHTYIHYLTTASRHPDAIPASEPSGETSGPCVLAYFSSGSSDQVVQVQSSLGG